MKYFQQVSVAYKIFMMPVLVIGLIGLAGLTACNTADDKAESLDDPVTEVVEATELPPPAIVVSSLAQATDTPSVEATDAPTATSESTETEDSEATETPTPDLTATVSLDSTPVSDPNVLRGEHYWLGRPFSTSNGVRDLVEPAYPYGTTALGLQPHHGVDIPNAFGTAVRAVASGVVFYAGDDLNSVTFGPQPNFYGNVIVVEHHFEIPDSNGVIFTFYTLYGHLSQFYVRTGDRVSQFQEIGAVGQAGVAIGPHLHLEVRIGDPYDYTATYNPNLWIQPYPSYGVLAGRVIEDGQLLTDIEVEVISQQTGRTHRTQTYHYDQVNPDPWFRENFVFPDLTEGRYDVQVKYQGRIAYQTTIDIKPEQTTLVNAALE